MRELDHYVVLEPGGGERILTAAETLAWLEARLAKLEPVPADLLQDIKRIPMKFTGFAPKQ